MIAPDTKISFKKHISSHEGKYSNWYHYNTTFHNYIQQCQYVSGPGNVGSAGAFATALFSVSVVCVISMKIGVILIYLIYYTLKLSSPIVLFNRVYFANSNL